MRYSEMMIIRLVGHTLKFNGDIRLKGLPLSSRLCDQLDLAAMDNARHLVLQCPK